MKKLAYSIALLLFSTSVFANNIIPPELVGKWLFPGNIEKFSDLTTFNADGSFTAERLLATRLSSQRIITCVIKTSGTIFSIESKGDKKMTVAGKIDKVELLYPAPGNTAANCQETIKYMPGVTYLLPLTDIDYKVTSQHPTPTFNIDFGTGKDTYRKIR